MIVHGYVIVPVHYVHVLYGASRGRPFIAHLTGNQLIFMLFTDLSNLLIEDIYMYMM